jgi:DNA processing protein
VQETNTSRLPSQAPDVADWIRLDQTPGIGPMAAGRLLAAFGTPQHVFRAGYTALAGCVSAAQASALCQPMSPNTARLVDLTLGWLAQPGHHVLTLHDAAYPEVLANIADPPMLLYISGRRELLARPALAIVGSRNASAQGKANAEGFAHALSDAGMTIVSGLALGIDAAAHQGALRGAGSTIAVVGTGVGQVYPVRNRALAQRIAAQGCIVSEYPLGTPPLSPNFPRRNRIISGLSAGVLVVEAAARSGSLITAHLAAEQGREVFAIPGSIHAALSKGCHALIREGARLVESAAEVVEAMRLSPLATRPVPPLPQPAGCAALLEALGSDPALPDTLLALTAGDPGQLSSQLLVLELAGLVERLPGGLVQRIYQ